jgi:hypothetical protein
MPEPASGSLVPAPFVVGVPRSGTTLLRLMLDAHPELAIPAETHFLPPLIRRVTDLERSGATAAEVRAAVLAFIVEHPRFGDLDVPETALAAHLAGIETVTAADAARAVHVVHAELQGKPRWGDKTPRYVRRMASLHETLEEARFVHVIRDGRDVAVSLSEVSWGTADAAEAAGLWKEVILGGRKNLKRIPPETYLEVRYEDLVAGPEAVLRRVASFVELRWDERMLAYHERATARMAPVERDFEAPSGRRVTAAERRRQHAGVDEPPRRDRVGRWRDELGSDQVARFEAVAGDLLEELGYPRG